MRTEPRVPGRPSRAVVFLPLAVFVAATLLLGTYWIEADRQEAASIRLKTRLSAEQAALRVEQFLASRLHLVEHVARVWADRPAPTEARFREHVESLTEAFPNIVALNWIDADGVIRWVVPEEPNRPALGRDLTIHPVAGPVLEAARASGALRLTGPLTLYQGGEGFAAYVPVRRDGRVTGFVNAAFRTGPLLDEALTRGVRDNFYFEIADGAKEIYAVTDPAEHAGRSYRETRSIAVGDRNWFLTLWPTDEQVAADRTVADEVIVAIGILIAAGLAAASWRIARSRAAIAAAERRYRGVVEDSPVLICRADPAGRLTFVNDAYARHFGRTPEELIGSSFFDLVPKDEHDRLRTGLARLSPQRPTQRLEHRVIQEGGGTGWVDWINRARFAADGTMVELQAFGVDRTEAHEARRELEKSEARFREIFNTVSDGILVLDPAGSVLDVNPRAGALFGVEPGALIGRDVASLEADGEVAGASLSQLVRQVANDGSAAAVRERDVRRPGGTWRADVELRRAVIGDEPRVLAVVRDVTERSRLEEQLRQSQKMEAMGTLASGIAHDFNNVLTAILGHAEIAREYLSDDSPAVRSVEGIAAACDQASGVTRALLAMGRRGRSRRVPMEVAATVRRTLQVLRPLLPDAIEVHKEIPERETLWIEGDDAQIQQVLINLVLNARDAISEDGRITVALRAERDDEDGRSRVVLQVSDNGVGMSDEVRRRVLEPFFTTKPRERGTGLGMSVVHGIVLAHDGSLAIDSRPGHGTSVTVRLPSCAPAVGKETPAADEVATGGATGGRILVVEDNAQVRRLLLDALTSAGYVVESATDGIDGLQAWNAARGGIDLLIVDLDLPRMGGEELVRRIRTEDRDTPVILISGNPEVGHRLEDDPAVGFLEKPFRMTRVVERVARVLGRTE